MGQLWTDEMEADLERWQAAEAEAWSPDFLIPGRLNLSDRIRGLTRYVVAAIRYRMLGGWEPLSLQQQIESANIDRQLGPERIAESEAFMEEPFDFSGDFDWFES